MQNNWNGNERRNQKSHSIIHEDIINHIDKKFDELREDFRSAFPNGNLDEHRHQHEEATRILGEKAQLWLAVKEKVLTGAVWAAFGLIFMASMGTLKEWFKS